MHNLIVSALAGVVQGLTEFIPISSSAHLIIFQKYFETSMDIGLSFDVAVHLATALAVIFYFRKYLLTEIKEAIYFKSKIIINLISATIPAALVGFYFEPYIRVQFRSLEIVILGLVLGSLIIIAAEFYNRQKGIQNKEYSIFSSFIVGLFQALALIPGLSRSGATISGGLLFTKDREYATKFAFLMAPPIIFGATLKLILEGDILINSDFLVGFIAAFLSGLLAVKTISFMMRRSSLLPFVWYRLALALVLYIYI